MELYEVMRTTFAAREFTDDPLPDATLVKILDNARFAPSGGNRQGAHVIVIRDRNTREALAALNVPGAKRYIAQIQAGESPWNPIDPPRVSAEVIERTAVPARMTEPLLKAPVVLAVCVDLRAVAAVDQHLDRVGIIAGASVYPFVWSILLAARNEGFGGTLTTIAIAEEPKLKELLGIPAHVAVAAIVPLGRPVKQLNKLRRKQVGEFAVRGRWGGEPLS
jgi:nitroreductase